MSKEFSFNWDVWTKKASYDDVIKSAPLPLFTRPVPTSICPKNPDIIYINSLDEPVGFDDWDQLKLVLTNIVRSYKFKKINNNGFGVQALVLAQRQYDFEALCLLIQTNVPNYPLLFEDEHDYSVSEPEELFKEILNKLS